MYNEPSQSGIVNILFEMGKVTVNFMLATEFLVKESVILISNNTLCRHKKRLIEKIKKGTKSKALFYSNLEYSITKRFNTLNGDLLIQLIQSVSRIWTSLTWLISSCWFGFRLKPIFATAPSCLKNRCSLPKWSKETQK